MFSLSARVFLFFFIRLNSFQQGVTKQEANVFSHPLYWVILFNGDHICFASSVEYKSSCLYFYFFFIINLKLFAGHVFSFISEWILIFLCFFFCFCFCFFFVCLFCLFVCLFVFFLFCTFGLFYLAVFFRLSS